MTGDISVTIDLDGAPIRIRITQEAMSDHLGYDGGGSFIPAINDNIEKVEEIVRRKLAAGTTEPVVIFSEDF